MRKYLLPLLHPFMTAFEACAFNFLLEKPAKNCLTFVKVPIILLTGSVRFGFGDFSSGSGSVRPNQKILVRSTTNFYRTFLHRFGHIGNVKCKVLQKLIS